MELMEGQFDERVRVSLAQIELKLRPKLKKRIKMKQLSALFLAKMGREEAINMGRRLDDKIDMMDNKFEYGMPPAMLQKLEKFNH